VAWLAVVGGGQLPMETGEAESVSLVEVLESLSLDHTFKLLQVAHPGQLPQVHTANKNNQAVCKKFVFTNEKGEKKLWWLSSRSLLSVPALPWVVSLQRQWTHLFQKIRNQNLIFWLLAKCLVKNKNRPHQLTIKFKCLAPGQWK